MGSAQGRQSGRGEGGEHCEPVEPVLKPSTRSEVCVVTTIVLHDAADAADLLARTSAMITSMQQLEGCMHCELCKAQGADWESTFVMLEVWCSIELLETYWDTSPFPDVVAWIREKATVQLSFPTISELGVIKNEVQSGPAQSNSRRRRLLSASRRVSSEKEPAADTSP
ncbi:hypothetical protein AB1Y20_010023 [Prymnesium parvum]|uniref:ABM domain-containing protein n=1 Tax=Prymnesium parvum TaxID=97485 RepID=A0AB34K3U0_PRYPA